MDDKEKERNIINWIKLQGYPFEMYCSNILTQNGFVAVQALNYEDLESGKLREIDIVAHKIVTVDGVSFNISLVIECKVSKKNPWILFSNKSLYHNSFNVLQNPFATDNGIKLVKLAETKFAGFSLFKMNDQIGFNLTQGFTNGKDVTFEALMSTQNACLFLIDRSNKSYKPFCNIYFPVIAIDAEFYKCFPTTADEIDLEKIEIEKLLTFRSFSNRPNTLHTIVTKEYFPTFIANLSTEIDTFFANCKPEFEEIAKKYPGTNRYGVL